MMLIFAGAGVMLLFFAAVFNLPGVFDPWGSHGWARAKLLVHRLCTWLFAVWALMGWFGLWGIAMQRQEAGLSVTAAYWLIWVGPLLALGPIAWATSNGKFQDRIRGEWRRQKE